MTQSQAISAFREDKQQSNNHKIQGIVANGRKWRSKDLCWETYSICTSPRLGVWKRLFRQAELPLLQPEQWFGANWEQNRSGDRGNRSVQFRELFGGPNHRTRRVSIGPLRMTLDFWLIWKDSAAIHWEQDSGREEGNQEFGFGYGEGKMPLNPPSGEGEQSWKGGLNW